MTSPTAEEHPPPQLPPAMRRRRRRAAKWLAIAFAVFVFLGISALLARALSAAGSERAQVLDVLRAQARGDAEAVLAQMPACRASAGCAAMTRRRTAALKRPGRVEILTYDPTTELALSDTTGTARVAWRAGTGLPVVQCVRAHRGGPLSGDPVELLSISAPIGRQSACPD